MSAVLVIRPSSLGDIVYALAIVTDIRRYRPELAIDWVSERGFAPLLAMCPDIRNVVPFALRRWREAPFARATWREIGLFRRELRTFRYTAILDLQEQVKGAIVARVARGRRHGFDRASVREPLATLGHDIHHRVSRTLHFVDRCRALAGASLGYVVDAPPRWHIVPPPTAPGLPEQPYAVLLHATSRPEKLWPEAHWRTLASHFARAGVAPLFLWGGPAEEARSRRLAAGIDDAIVPPWLSLPEAAAVLAHAEIVVGVDTGFTHLAGALGTPTVGLFFATDPILHGVSCTGAHARDLGGEHGIPGVDEVVAAAGLLLRAAPRC